LQEQVFLYRMLYEEALENQKVPFFFFLFFFFFFFFRVLLFFLFVEVLVYQQFFNECIHLSFLLI
ncbi:competence protein CoiA, partial [Enterococcus faecium]